MRRLILIIAAILTASVTLARADDRIKYDSQCFIIDGKDTFLYSGAFHYFRCPKPLWSDRLQRFKDAGMNCVETYIPWNWHEQNPPSGLDDYSQIDMSDLTDFLDLAINKYGLYVILRPGPYICAEWDGGGYPQWLLTKKPASAPAIWYRTDEPTYLAWCKHWYTAVAKAAAPFQITHQPAGKTGVILWQIENEYNYAKLPASVKLNQLLALAHDSRDAGIDVPLITCMTNDPLFKADPYLQANVIECRNTYPRFNPTEDKDLTLLDTYQPDKPKMVTELQGGWFSEVGKQLSGDMGYTAAHITHVTLVAWADGFTGTNYYMMYGGTNLGDWGSQSKTTSYDYAAPIREWGGVGDRYFAVEGMANFLKEHGSQLARSKQISVMPSSGPKKVVVRQAADGSQFVFVFNNDSKQPVKDEFDLTANIKISYDLDPYGAKIFYLPPGATDESKGTWYPQPGAAPVRPTNLPAAVSITEMRQTFGDGPPENSWHDLPDGASIEDAGIFDRRFVFYRAKLNVATTQPDSINLSASLPRQDSFIAQVDRQWVKIARAGRGAMGGTLPASGDLLLLYENGGRDNNGAIDNRSGLHNFTIKSAEGPVPTHWQISGDSDGSIGKWWDPALDESGWMKQTIPPMAPAANLPVGVRLQWSRMSFELPAVDPHVWVPWKLHLEATGNGFIYLNGHALGRWWEAGPQKDFYLPECWLNFGAGSKNNITLCLRPTNGWPAVNAAEVSPYADFAEAR